MSQPFGGILDGRTAIVTGGSRGIGRAIVERLARDGADVVFGYARDHDAAREVTKTVDHAGGRAHGVQVDLGDAGQVRRFLEDAHEHLGALDVLVNNAAAEHRPASLAETSEDDYDRVMAVNTKAVFLALGYAATHMRDGGRIVNISTLNTVLASPGISAYAASKGAVEQLTRVAAQELGPRGITVNAVSPGATDTDLLRATNTPEGLERFVGMTPLRRLGQPADIADVVAFLAGPDARWLTGQNIRATGGIG